MLVTAEGTVETAVEAMRRGATDYLTKPVDLERVRKVLTGVAHTHELRQLATRMPWGAARRRAVVPASNPAQFGRFEVHDEIGEGTMGRVFRGHDPLVGRIVAIKTVRPEYLTRGTREEYLRRFRREAQAAGILSHPHIVQIYDVAEDYIVMEYVEGVTLEELLRHQPVLDRASALRILSPLAEALDYAHQAGVIHRDIKPANVMVQPDGRPKLMDFGIARLETTAATDTGHSFGSPSYMAPEQVLSGEASRGPRPRHHKRRAMVSCPP